MSSKGRRCEVPFMELGARNLKRVSNLCSVSDLFVFYSACTIIRVLGRAFSSFILWMQSGNVPVLNISFNGIEGVIIAIMGYMRR